MASIISNKPSRSKIEQKWMEISQGCHDFCDPLSTYFLMDYGEAFGYRDRLPFEIFE
jgi:hypothetical protein